MPRWKRKNSRNYQGKVWDAIIGGWTKAKSLHVRDPRAADAALAEWERDLADPARAAAKRYTVKDALDGLGKHLTASSNRGETASATLAYHASKASPLIALLGPKLLAELTPQLVEAYRDARKEEGVSLHSATKELRTLHYAMRIAKLNKQYSGDLKAVFPRMPSGYKPRERTLSEGELIALLLVAGPDIGAQIAFSVATSAEAKCILTARREDIAPDLGYVHLRGTKRAMRRRTVPMVTPLQKQLIEYARDNAQGTEGLLFAGSRWGLSTMLRKLSAKLGMEHVTPNDLRRTCATTLRRQGAPIDLIAALMGHTDTTMVERVYGRLSPEALSELLSAALNAGSSVSDTVARSGTNGHILTHSGPPSTRKVEPTPRLELGTYGLRNCLLFVDSTVNPPQWQIRG